MRSIAAVVAVGLSMMTPTVEALAADPLDLDAREFRTTWRKSGTGDKITFDNQKKLFGAEFSGKFTMFNTSDGTYSSCTPGKDGGANLCVSGRLFDCAFLVTWSTGNIGNLSLRRAGFGDEFCRNMSGDYVILLPQ